MAAARDAAKAEEVFSELGLSEGMNGGSGKVSMHLFHFMGCQRLADSKAGRASRTALTLKEGRLR